MDSTLYNSAVNTNQQNEDDSEEKFEVSSYHIQRIRDEGASYGYAGYDMEKGWESIEHSIAHPIEKDVLNENEDRDEFITGFESELKKRLDTIRTDVCAKLQAVNTEVKKLDKRNFTSFGSKLMIWIGWLSVTSLGWVFSWILYKLIQNQTYTGDSLYVINDIVALFVKSFNDLNKLLVQTYPAIENYQWLILLIGIVMVLIAIIAYLNVQKLNGEIKIVENVIGLFAQMPSNYEEDVQNEKKEHKHTNLQRAFWIIVVIGFGLPGFGILLSSINSDYSLSVMILGYSMAAIVIAVMMLILHIHYEKIMSSDDKLLFPRWIINLLIYSTFSLLAILLICLIFVNNENLIYYVQCIAVSCIGFYLTLGTFILALGIICNNIYRTETHWQLVLGHIDLRMRHLEAKIDKRIEELKERKRKVKEKLNIEKTRLSYYKRVYVDSYKLGDSARKRGIKI